MKVKLSDKSTVPLAERVRPLSLDDVVGQEHLVGQQGVLRRLSENQAIPSMILWGPPGVGKTTIARIIAHESHLPFYTFSAISAGVKEVRTVIQRSQSHGRCMLFIDEIHRFNKSQQDALLGAVEKGSLVLVGATTENPSFEVNAALLSRCQVYTFNPLNDEHMLHLAHKLLQRDEITEQRKIILKEHSSLLSLARGDARKLINIIAMIADMSDQDINITNELVMKMAQQRTAIYDKKGDMHYDLISAFIKSVRGSDPNAAIYYLARMIEAGEEVTFIARRMIILASEDIGNANPDALVLATATFQAVRIIGYPEARIVLSQCAVYLANAPKSNTSYVAINKASRTISATGDLLVPLSIRNAPDPLMKKIGYSKDYRYAHDCNDQFASMEFLPKKIAGMTFYEPGDNAQEKEWRERLKKLWKQKYSY